MFQFPSNGKAYPKPKWRICLIRNYCFNSLQTGKHIQRQVNIVDHISKYEVSIPFKRESISKGSKKRVTHWLPKFQFPSNGKAYPKCPKLPNNPKLPKVSIPFKRESISKVLRQVPLTTPILTSFNSLQTGKHIQSE